MKLYYANGACSIGIHILLEEIGKPYDKVPLKLSEGDQYKPDFVAINPKSKVPALVRDDGAVMTEYPSIAVWLARTNPDKHLMPADPLAEAKALEVMDYAVGTMHMQGFGRLFRPGNFGPSEADQEAVKARGMEIATKGFGIMDKALAGHDYVAGAFSVADTALFYVEMWGSRVFKMDLPANCAAHYARMLARPSVKAVMSAEGLEG